ncbi:UNKNOWN [Stylonychia lemnae]|uniref:Uncharacterized protein n=1 Tax=Stylonychia lemnae TaxID=5949 RepID=A0A078A8E7_STYLE|nr:UNKNOWN [Stylonychia lemnae]|eukprot:CDW78499.1 UNKNOWN [Stylonychia lemnae]
MVDFDDCFQIIKPKDYIKANKKNIVTLQSTIEATRTISSPPKTTTSPQNKTRTQFPTKTLIEKQKEQMQQQLDKIKRIIMSNPYKFSNYMEHNSALVPEKLINLNQVDPSPVFDDDYDDDEQNFYNQLAKNDQEQGVKSNKKRQKFNKDLVKQYQLYKKLHHIKAKGDHQETSMPLDFKDKIQLLEEEKAIFGVDSGDENLKSPFGKITKRINSQQSNKDLGEALTPKYHNRVSFHKRSISIMDPSVQQLETLQNSNFQLPELSGILNPDESSPLRIETQSYLPDQIKQYLQKKNNIDSSGLKSKQRKTNNRTSLDLKNNINHFNQENMNVSSILLKQAKDIVTQVNKQSHNNIGLIKLSKDLRNQIVQESPSQITLQRDIFDNYDNFKLKSRHHKFQVEDLYIKRENGLPLEILEEMEREEEEKQQYIQSMETKLRAKGSALSNLSILQEQKEGFTGKTSMTSTLKMHSAQPSPIKKKQESTDMGGFNSKFNSLEQDVQKRNQVKQTLNTETNDVFDLNNNINKFSYQNMKNERELRELKLQTQSKYQSVERMAKLEQIKKNIDSYKEFKEQREKALMQIREVARANNGNINSHHDIKLPKLKNFYERSYTDGRYPPRNNTYNFQTLQHRRKQDVAIDAASLSTRRVSLKHDNMTIDKWGEGPNTGGYIDRIILSGKNMLSPHNLSSDIRGGGRQLNKDIERFY